MLFNPLRVKRLSLVAGLLALAATAACGQHSPHSAGTVKMAPDPPATHGMLLVGTQQVFASHLPMFNRPHDYQVWLELELDSATLKTYQTSRRAYPQEALYTLEPEKFVLPAMVAKPHPFRASLYRGHFERGGTAIVENVEVHIKKVLYFRQLNPQEAPPTHPAYLLLGNAQEQFLAHRIAGQPGYDQVLRVTVPKGKLTEQLKAQGLVSWEAAAGGPAPLKAPAGIKGHAAPGLRLEQSIYLEFDDLR
ncbi:hypothetical protein GCM10023185_05760 [Hymenobacter saemangeumensis]|uniref:DUF4198 domain-containing protein n=1 Tax=Hymenobacter saemangeumensis TaxID=1084522 RepID=A0ABP8I167_9BACT